MTVIVIDLVMVMVNLDVPVNISDGRTNRVKKVSRYLILVEAKTDG